MFFIQHGATQVGSLHGHATRPSQQQNVHSPAEKATTSKFGGSKGQDAGPTWEAHNPKELNTMKQAPSTDPAAHVHSRCNCQIFTVHV